MGSLRNPIGPLPSSIYWRRRAVGLALLVLLIVLVLWAVNVLSQGGAADSEGDGRAHHDSGEGPARSITPGPTDDESATISGRPGGRAEASDRPDGSDGPDGASPSGDGGTHDAGTRVPASDGLPSCAQNAASLRLRSVEDAYETGDLPKVELIVRNSGSGACAVDFGPTAAVVSISDVDGIVIWASDHCPADRGAAMSRVPAGGKASFTLSWNRQRSAADCATPTAGTVRAGTYLVEAELRGGLRAETSFVLARD